MSRRSGSLAVLLPLVMAACAHGTLETSVRAGRWQDALAQFAADSTRRYSASTLREMAYLHAHPDSATWDPARAVSLLAAARGDRPARDAAQDRLERVLVRLQSEETRAAARHDTLLHQIAQTDSALTFLRMQRDSLAARVVDSEEARALLQRLVSRLESDLRDRESQLLLLRQELRQLKDIDLLPIRKPPSPK